MGALDIIKKELKNHPKYKITPITANKIKIEIPSGLDFQKTSQEIFNAIILIKPELGTGVTIRSCSI
jgi:hypothetical protein